jgi:serpin B
MRAKTFLAVIAAAVFTASCAGPARSARSRPSTRPAAPGPARVSVGPHIGSAVELVSRGSGSTPNEPDAATQVARAEEDFALRLLRQLDNDDAGNVTVSPWSAAVALAMLENGAHGSTLDEIQRTLGTQSLDPGHQDAGWASLIGSLTQQSAADGIALQSANALWLQGGLPMSEAFMKSMAAYFDTGVWQVDFAHHLASALDAVNKWVAGQTGNKITKLFDPTDVDHTTQLVLADAVHFQANWQSPFDSANSQPGTFYSPSGAATATYMEQSVSGATITSAYQEVRLPYAGGHFEAVAIMPEGQNLNSFLRNLNPARLDSILAATEHSAQVRLPRFTTTNYVKLNNTLSTMGMPLAFTSGADFSAMSPVPLQVQNAVQRDYLSVGEKGTEAAAATGISMMPTAARVSPDPTITLDHPFLFLIRDASSGTILFSSLIHSPTS